MIRYLYCCLKITGIVFLLAGCASGPTVAVASPSPREFLLGADVFPAGWDGPSFSQDEESEVMSTRSFYKPNEVGHAYQDIYRRSNDWSASDQYKTYLESDFKSLVPPAEIAFRSKIADEYYFACGVDLVTTCRMIARYHNYFVYFYFDLSTKEQPGGLTYAQIEHVLEAFENRVTTLFRVQSTATPVK